MKKALKTILVVLEVIFIVYVLSLLIFLLCRNDFNYTQLGSNTYIIVDKSNSNYFTNFKKGDLVVLSAVDFEKIKQGDELYYYSIEKQNYVVKSGIVFNVIKEDDAYLITFEASSVWPISSEKIIGDYQNKSYKGVGSVLAFLTSNSGFLLCVILPILIFFLYQILRVIISAYKENKQHNIEEKSKYTEKKYKTNKDVKKEKIKKESETLEEVEVKKLDENKEKFEVLKDEEIETLEEESEEIL